MNDKELGNAIKLLESLEIAVIGIPKDKSKVRAYCQTQL